MNRQIEKLKEDIAADDSSARALEIEELNSRLYDLALHMNSVNKPGADVHALLEETMRSYWSALILARQAIEVAEQNRQTNAIDPRLAGFLGNGAVSTTM